MIPIVSKLPKSGSSIFSIMSSLAREKEAINLSQGFPDFDCSPTLIKLVHEAMNNGHNQYAPMPGILPLRKEIAHKTARLHGAHYDPETEITITAGATQAIFTAICACIHPNDEVIIFEPAYDSYAPIVKMMGGMVKYMELEPPDYAINWDMVKKLISSKTRMIILNTPHNPTGIILKEEDIRELSAIVKNQDILILSDEVYEHIVFDGQRHLSLCRYPELMQRSFIVASFGKLCHTTGWKMGYCMAPANLMKEFQNIHQFQVFSVNTPIQFAITSYLQNEDNYLVLSDFFQQKRDYFRQGLALTRFKLLPCAGSYFQSVKFDDISQDSDLTFAKRLVIDFGVASIPNSAFYSKGTDHQILRFCFAKKQETLAKAVELLKKV
ncbi:MAG: methionine aminotransferase [Sphingobacteriaceae bacterium]